MNNKIKPIEISQWMEDEINSIFKEVNKIYDYHKRKHRHAKRARVIFLVMDLGAFVELFTVMIWLSFLGGCDVQKEGNWKSIIRQL